MKTKSKFAYWLSKLAQAQTRYGPGVFQKLYRYAPIARGAAGSGRPPEYETRLSPLLAALDKRGCSDADGGIAT